VNATESVTDRLDGGHCRSRVDDRLVNGEVDIESDSTEQVEGIDSDQVQT